MKVAFAMAVAVLGSVLAGCIGDNTSADETETDRYIRQNTDWHTKRSIIGGAYNDHPNDDKELR